MYIYNHGSNDDNDCNANTNSNEFPWIVTTMMSMRLGGTSPLWCHRARATVSNSLTFGEFRYMLHCCLSWFWSCKVVQIDLQKKQYEMLKAKNKHYNTIKRLALPPCWQSILPTPRWKQKRSASFHIVDSKQLKHIEQHRCFHGK